MFLGFLGLVVVSFGFFFLLLLFLFFYLLGVFGIFYGLFFVCNWMLGIDYCGKCFINLEEFL